MIPDEILQKARCEIKFVTNVGMYNRLKQWILLHDMMFRKAYPSRVVNNIYFDNHALESYWENLTGKSSRTKFRLRWYGSNMNTKDTVLELKIKRNKLGWKSQENIRLNKNICDLNFNDIINELKSNASPELKQRFHLSDAPVLINSYERDYFVSCDNKIRITLDRNIYFYDQRFYSYANKKYRGASPEIVILEFKFAADDLHLAEKAMENLEVSPSKVSKYVMGVQSVLGI
ncbi:MAG: polyphosphate polymerase domain-containing protein [Elusimicrobiota bacterium]